MRRTAVVVAAFLFATYARAQSDTLPSSSSTAGVSILGAGRSIKPAELTPTGPRTPPAPTLREFQPLVPQPEQRRKR